MKLEITPSQKWLIVKALTEFTDDEAQMKFQSEFPDCDLEAMAEDITDLIQKIEKLK